MTDLLEPDVSGLTCAAGRFTVDPARPVGQAVITHAHADHARPGSGRYWCAAPGAALLRHRLGEAARIEAVPYGEPFALGGTRVSFHPAGHVLGSAQVRIERGGEVWVVSGDYKRDPDPTCAPFEPVRCDVFVTEATFALPVYRWPPVEEVIGEVVAWWQECADQQRPAVLLGYALGKAQRLLALLAGRAPRPVLTHGAVEAMAAHYRAAGVRLAATRPAAGAERGAALAGELVVAPPIRTVVPPSSGL